MPKKGRSPEAGTQLTMDLPFTSPNEPNGITLEPFRSTTYDPEQFMADWAFMFESRRRAAGKLRNDFDAKMADHEFREFLKRIGAITPDERRTYLEQVVTPEQIAFLQHLGVWDQITSSTFGYDEIEALRPLLEGSQAYWVDPTSVEERDTIFASPAALARYQAQGGAPLPQMQSWIEKRRARNLRKK